MLPIAVRGLRKRFGDRTVLDDVWLSVAAGETVVVLGPSGAGKSTLLRCVAGLLPFDAGEVEVDALTLRPGVGGGGQALAVRPRLGFVFQDFGLFPHKRAWENVALAPRLVRGLPALQARDLAMQLLAKVGLEKRADAFPAELSGGEKQRVAIARALAMAPLALLGDEITSSLDPELKWEVAETLVALKKEGLTVLLVTHEVALARHVGDRVVLLVEGRVVEEGPAATVLSQPLTLRGQQFLSRWLL